MSKTIENILYFFTASVVTKIIATIGSFIVARLLQPGGFGVWVTISLIPSYAPIVCLGTVETLLKEYPYLSGKGNMGKAKKLEENVFGSLLLASGLIIGIGVVFTQLDPLKVANGMEELFLAMFFSSALGFFSAFFFCRFIARQEFKVVSLVDGIKASILLLMVVFCCWIWGLKGTIFGFLVAQIQIFLLLGYISFKLCGNLKMRFDIKEIWELIKIGFPITIVWWFFILQSSIDRIMSMSLLGKAATGYYGLGMSIVATLILVPQVIGQVLYPKINEAIGRDLGEEEIKKLVLMPTRTISLVLPGILGILCIISPMIYSKLFPQYGPGLVSGQILLVGAFFICLMRNGVNYLIATNKQSRLVLFVFLALMVKIIGNFAFVKMGLGIEGIAISSSISAAALTSIIWLAVFKGMGYRPSEYWRELFFVYSPFLLMILAGLALISIIPEVLATSGGKSFIFSLIFALVFGMAIFLLPPFKGWTRDLLILSASIIRAALKRPVVTMER